MSAVPPIATELLRRSERSDVPIASFCNAEKQRAVSPSNHFKVGHRPADWGMILFPTLQQAAQGIAPGEGEVWREYLRWFGLLLACCWCRMHGLYV
jgi:hypothetical protein